MKELEPEPEPKENFRLRNTDLNKLNSNLKQTPLLREIVNWSIFV